GLARAVGAEEAEELAGRHREGDAVQRAGVLPVDLDQVADLDNRAVVSHRVLLCAAGRFRRSRPGDRDFGGWAPPARSGGCPSLRPAPPGRPAHSGQVRTYVLILG